MSSDRSTSHSKEKFEEMILNELNLLLRTQIADPRAQFVSLTNVKLNRDFSQAKVYWDTFDASKRGDTKKAIEGMSSKLRTHLAKNLKLRHTPSLQFFYDSQFEDELKITKLLKDEE